MKIMLIYIPSINNAISSPLGLCYIASCLEQVGHKVKIIDSIATKSKHVELDKNIKNFDPDVVGINSISQYIYNAYSVVKRVKELNPNCLTVLGGPHPTVLPRQTLEECPRASMTF